LYGGTNDFKIGYQPRTDIVKYEKGDRIADTHGVVGRWRNHFSQLLNVKSRPVTGLEWPRGFQEDKVPRCLDNGTGCL
jgi:hypothetical protein